MNEDRISVKNALIKGDLFTKLSVVIMGAGIAGHRQIVKGAVILLLEIAFFGFMISTGAHNLSMMPTLGTEAQGKVWNEAKQIYEYSAGDNSQQILLAGVITCFVIAGFIALWILQLRHSYKLQKMIEKGEKVPSLGKDVKNLFDSNLHFNIVPLVYMITMAFTTYSKEGEHLVLFDWDGLHQFQRVLNMNGNIGRQFWHVLAWTVVWAIFSTFLNYILGMMLAMVINRKDTKWKGFWRFCFVLSIAVPQFVSLMIMNIMLQPSGAVNVLLRNLGLISEPIPFWTNPMLARIMIILINLWIGIPYTMLIVTGLLMNIPAELYESARIDGANAFQTFRSITLPYMLFVTGPFLLTQFTGNLNNFNVIFLLNQGKPQAMNLTGNAGYTDLLVTWLYKMTVNDTNYRMAAVIGIMVFIVTAVVSLVVYNLLPSVKDEEGFQ